MEIGLKARKQVLAYIIMLMELNMKANGLMTNNMIMVERNNTMANIMRDFLRME